MPEHDVVSYDTLEGETSSPVELRRAEIGLKLAQWLLGVVLFVLVLVGVFAALTYPESSASASATDVPGSLEVLRATWFDQIKDLLQLLVVSLLIPLLATLIGYIFGREVGASSG